MTAPDPRLGEIEALIIKAITNAQFGDVLRIIWTTYYFGADLQWHNARTGLVEQPEMLAEEIEASQGDWGWLVPTADVAYLLAELRKRDDALGRVETLLTEKYKLWAAICGNTCSKDINGVDHDAIADEVAAAIRAAVAAAGGGE